MSLETLAEHSSLGSVPIYRIPLEVLSQIFCFSIPEPDKDESSFLNIQLLAHCISTLARVESRWKNTVYATPALWSTFSLDGEDIRVNNVWMERWLSRSRVLPLDIALNFSDGSTDRASLLVGKFLQSHLRIRSLHLEGDIMAFLPVFHLPRDALPLLEELHLSIERVGNDLLQPLSSLLPPQPEAFGDSANLRRLKVEDCDEVSILERLALPLQLLESLQLRSYDSNIDPTVYLRALNQCHALESLDIYLSGHYRGTISKIPCTLHSLKSLEARPRTVSSDHASSLLSNLSAPSLENFHLHLSSFEWDRRLAQISDFQRRSGFLLRSLTLDLHHAQFDYATDFFGGMLSLFPTVTCLSIRNALVGMQSMLITLLDMLVIDPSTGPVFLPQLEEFKLELGVTGSAKPRMYPSLLTRMILSRWRSHPSDGGAAAAASADVIHSHGRRLALVTLRGIEFSKDIAMLSELSGLRLDHK
ncbi:hypothetical protein D9757_012618 [Collybiopsis confluens]|uniref:F-box domain-containing protein n=1 Tax=Collybiopsis confluens TaxID=2823264 RepID=A0A8H5GI41_9AGAR|nr:hypothetical protein D9757_012618 [Collybiopsis confluens]